MAPRGKRYSIYDFWEENGLFRANPANIDAIDINGQSAYKGPVEFPKMFYHPEGDEDIIVPASVEQTPWGPQKMNEQRAIKTKLAQNEDEEKALRAAGWHDHPAKAIAAWNALRAPAEAKPVPVINSAEKIDAQAAQIEKLQRELEEMRRVNAGLGAAAPALVAPAGASPLTNEAIARQAAEAAKRVGNQAGKA